jgi:hypothetical protein
MGKIRSWLLRFGKAAWSALGWQRTVLVAVVTYISTYWDRFVVWVSDYIPSGLYVQIFQVPGWAIAVVVASALLAFFLVLRIMPHIKIEFDPENVECVHQIGNEPRKIFRVKVTNIGTNAIYCSGYLTKVTRTGVNAGLTGPLPLTFAPAEDGKDALRKLIQPEVSAHLDIGLAAAPATFAPATEFNPQYNVRIGRIVEQRMFINRGEYDLQITVTSDNAGAEKIDLILNLTNDWKTITISSKPHLISRLFAALEAKRRTHS